VTISTKILLERFYNEIQMQFGILLDSSKNQLILQNAALRASRWECRSVEEYFDFFNSGRFDQDEIDFWASLLTVNEAYFFRNEPDWLEITDTFIPNLIEKREQKKSLRVLSLGCSRGEEAYTLSLILASRFPILKDWNVSIVAGDINTQLIQLARAGGPYSNRSILRVEKTILNEYFTRKEDGWYLDKRITSTVAFRRMNIIKLSHSLIAQRFDLIFCRNVLIYFLPETARNIIRTLTSYLASDGRLIFGHSEGNLAIDAGCVVDFRKGCISITKENKSDPSYPQTNGKRELPHYDIVGDSHDSSPFGMHHHEWQSPKTLIDTARKQMEHGNLGDALHVLRSVLLRTSESVEAHYLLAVLFQNLGDIPNAISSYQRVIQLSPNHKMSYLQLAMLHIRLGNTQSARQCFHTLSSLIEPYAPEDVVDEDRSLTVGFLRMLCADADLSTQLN